MGFLDFLFGSNEQESAEEKAAREQQKRLDTLKHDGIRAKQMRELPYALRCFQEALRLCPEDEQTQSLLAETLMQMGMSAEAHPLLQQLAEKHELNLELQLLLMNAAATLQLWDEVLLVGERALALDDTDVRTHYLLSRAAHEKGLPEVALARLQTALSLNAHFTPALRLRAELHEKAERYAEAAEDVKAWLAVQPEDWEPYALLGRIKVRQGLTDEALAAYTEAYRCDPFSEGALMGLARTLEMTGQGDRALAVVSEFLSNQPAAIGAWLLRADLHEKAGEADKAATERAQAEKLANEWVATLEDDTEFTDPINRFEEMQRRNNPYYFWV